MATISYTFFGNGNSSYNIGSLVDWHESGLLADQLQVLLDGVEQSVSAVNGYTIDETNQTITFYSSSAVRAISGSEEITLNRVTPNTFFSTIETLGAASGSAALSNDKQLLNRIQEVENDIVVAQANSTIKDHQDHLVSIIKPGSGVGFSYNAGDGSLTISASGGGGSSSITIDFAEGIGEQTGSSFVLSQANTGFLIDSDLDDYVTSTSLNTTLNSYIQVAGFTSTYFTPAFNTAITPYTVKSIVGGTGITATTSAGVATIDLDSASTVTSVNGEIGDVLIDLRDHEDGDVISNHTGLKGCDHDSTEGVTNAGSPTTVDGWAWIHDQSEGSMITHKPLSGTRDSELIGGKTLTISGTIAGDTNDEIKLDSVDRLVQAAFADERYHIKSEWQESAQNGGVNLSTSYDATGISKNAYTSRQLYLAPIDGNGTADTTSGYIYPDQFQGASGTGTTLTALGANQSDSTGYHPGVRYIAYDSNLHTRPVFYPGVSYTLHSQASIVPGQVAYASNFIGDTSQYWTDSGITEPLYNSGNIRSNAPARLFAVSDTQDTWTADDTYTNEFGGTSASYMNPVDGIVHTGTYGLIMHQSNTGYSPESNNQMNIFYVPANEAGGVMTINAEFNWYADLPRAYILLFAGMDEANKNLGPAESIIPVAGYNSDAQGTLANYQKTLSYTFDMSDGLPRYFGFASGHWQNGDSRSQGVSVRLSRSSYGSQSDYHAATLSNSASSEWTFRRNAYDRYVQDVLETYSVSQ